MASAVPEILHELKTNPKWSGTVVAVASCTDEPSWAQECMRKFNIGGGFSIEDAMQVTSLLPYTPRVGGFNGSSVTSHIRVIFTQR